MKDSIFSPLVGQWDKAIKGGWDFKQREFQNDAEECLRFYDGPYDFLYAAKATDAAYYKTRGDVTPARPGVEMTVNKVAEMVQLYGPVLFHKNPVRKATPRQVPLLPDSYLMGMAQDPMGMQLSMMLQQNFEASRSMDETRGVLFEHYLNYTPAALGLKDNARAAIIEALIKGGGVLWTEMYEPPGSGTKLVGSFYDTYDNLLFDPDAETKDEMKWVARRCIHPVWEVEDMYGLPRGTLKGHVESKSTQSSLSGDVLAHDKRNQNKTNDLLIYWKIWSKMGMGSRLAGMEKRDQDLDVFGDYCYLVVVPGYPNFLNLPPEAVEAGDMEGVASALQWPIPFWLDDAWPFSELAFLRKPRKLYPLSLLKPALGELCFINWVYSFVASKIKTTSRDFIAMKKSLGEDMKNAILSGKDLSLLEIEESHPGAITDHIGFLQHPDFNGDIWKVLEKVEELFEKRVGLTDLMYAQTPVQMRSAEEARVKSGQLQVRPDDMSDRVEDMMSEAAQKEALAAYWFLQPPDVVSILGQAGALAWGQLVTAAPPEDVLHKMSFRIEAGSTRKPNKDRDAANMNQAMQTLFAPLFQYAMQTANVGPVNTLITGWAKSIDMEPTGLLLTPPPMPMMPPPGGPPPEEGGPA